MAGGDKYNEVVVGALDVPAPTGQTFGHIQLWSDLYPMVDELVEDPFGVARPWWDFGAAVTARLEDLAKIYADFEAILKDLDALLKGSSGNALQDRGIAIANHTRKLIDSAEGYPSAADTTGHDIIVYAKKFHGAVKVFHQLTELKEDWAEKELERVWYANDTDSQIPETLRQRVRDAAYQIVEQEFMIPHQRKLLIVLSEAYAGKHDILDPITTKPPALTSIEVKTSTTTPPPDDEGSGGGSGGGNNSGTGGGGSGSGSGSGTGSGTTGNNKHGTGGGGTGGGSGSGSGSGSEYDDAVKDAENAALNAVEGLRKPTDSPERKQAYDDAEKAIKDAFDGRGNGSGSGSGSGSGTPFSMGGGGGTPSGGGGKTGGGGSGGGLGSGLDNLLNPGGNGDGSGDGSGSASGSTRPPTTSDPLAERKKAVQDADAAADKAMKDLLNPKSGKSLPSTVSDPKQDARQDAIHDAIDAKDKALGDLLKDTNGLDKSDLDRGATLKDAQDAVNDAIDELIKDNEKSNLDPDIKEAREDGLKDAQREANKAIEDLVDDAEKGGDGTAPGAEGREARETALDNVEDGVANAFDDLKHNSHSELRTEAIEDAKDAAEDVIKDLRKEPPDPGLGSPLEVEGDAYGDAKRELTHQFDELITDTLADKNLSDVDKLARVEALHDAKSAAMGAIDDATIAKASAQQSSMSEFLNGSNGGGSKTSGGSANLSSTNTGSGNQFGMSQGAGGGGGGGNPDGSPMVLDNSSLVAANGANGTGQGMPMAPPMGGGAGMTGQPRERDRNTWLDADPGLWDDDDGTVSWSAVGRNSP
jgi:hypothetical protein